MQRLTTYKNALLNTILLSSLLNISLFGTSPLFAFFSFLILTSLFSFFSITFPTNKRNNVISHYRVNILPLFFISLYVLYYFIQGYLLKQLPFSQNHYYILCSLIFLIALTLQTEYKFYHSFIKSTIILVTFESLFSIGQFLHVIPSVNPHFVVTGSWCNPNVSAMFLAVSSPTIVYILIYEDNKSSKILACIAGVLCIIALVMLQSRTGMLGVLFSSILFFAIILNKRKTTKIFAKPLNFLLIIGTFSLIIFFIFWSLSVKKNSTEGRFLISKVALQTFLKKPVLGVGLSMFEHDYNLEQGIYLQTPLATNNEKLNADYVVTSYNEVLNNLVEGGILATTLLLLVAFSLIFLSCKVFKNNNEKENDSFIKLQIIAGVGISTFLLMSVINFTILSVPVMCVFLVYISLIVKSNDTNAHSYTNRFKFESAVRFSPKMLAISSLALLIFVFQSNKAFTYKTIANIPKLKGTDNERTILGLYKSFEKDSLPYHAYWFDYANYLSHIGKYEAALVKYRKALSLSSNPTYYYALGTCFYKQKCIKECISAYTTAKNIIPNKFTYRYALLRLYMQKNDTVNALREACEITKLQVKVPSQKINLIKHTADSLISKYITNKN